MRFVVVKHIQYLHRNGQSLRKSNIKPCIEDICKYIHKFYNVISRIDFENDHNYFPDILRDYVQWYQWHEACDMLKMQKLDDVFGFLPGGNVPLNCMT